MLQTRKLTAATALTVLIVAGCAGVDGSDRGLIRENVIEPGITAIGEARDSACGINASTLNTAIEAYTLLIGEAPPNETALVDEGFLRDETTDWNVIDGQLVAENPACGEVPPIEPAPTEGAVGAGQTPTDQFPSIDELMSTLTADDIERLGGERCAREFYVAASALSHYEGENFETPIGSEVAAGGYLSQPLTLWEIVGDEIRPTRGSPCPDAAG